MQWWITDGPLPGGEEIDGPFESFDLAREARGHLENGTESSYWIDSTH